MRVRALSLAGWSATHCRRDPVRLRVGCCQKERADREQTEADRGTMLWLYAAARAVKGEEGSPERSNGRCSIGILAHYVYFRTCGFSS